MRLVVSRQATHQEAHHADSRRGVEDPRDVRIDGGQVIHVTCKQLPDGGRMLIYAKLTDLVESCRIEENYLFCPTWLGRW